MMTDSLPRRVRHSRMMFLYLVLHLKMMTRSLFAYVALERLHFTLLNIELFNKSFI